MKYGKLTIVTCSFVLSLLAGCGGSGGGNSNITEPSPEPIPDNSAPVVRHEPTYDVLIDENIIYAEGLVHDSSSTVPFASSIPLDVYYPNNASTNRPVFMFIHGGGFTGGTKQNPKIIEMANYYSSRGWVFVSIDYRTTKALGSLQGMRQEQVLTYYQGIAPQEWLEYGLQGAESVPMFQQSVAMYTAQRDAKAALRWIVANSSAYNINTEFITVGGASAGSITTVALGISNQEDFSDELTIAEDPTLATTHLNQNYNVKSMVYFWGSNIKLDVFEGVYQFNRYDADDPELFMGHGEAYDAVTPYEEALELQSIYDSLGIYSRLATLLLPNGDLAGHGAWDGVVEGKGLFELVFDFLVERQKLDAV
ncbi:hypothetical protein [Shewanella waksmanii]|uniref:hypothetical protein n=1 Tax=Shewanella waksmanii TaxID=213783 RepID=UPI00373510D2